MGLTTVLENGAMRDPSLLSVCQWEFLLLSQSVVMQLNKVASSQPAVL